MRESLITQMKLEIESNLKSFLHDEGIELHVAANDNKPSGKTPLIVLETIEDSPLQGYKLLSEIRVILGILGKPWQCDALVDGIYQALQPHQLTASELTVILMSLHVDAVSCEQPRKAHKRAVMRYIVEES